MHLRIVRSRCCAAARRAAAGAGRRAGLELPAAAVERQSGAGRVELHADPRRRNRIRRQRAAARQWRFDAGRRGQRRQPAGRARFQRRARTALGDVRRRGAALSQLQRAEHRRPARLVLRTPPDLAHVALFARNSAADVPTTELQEFVGVPFVRTGSRIDDLRGGVEAAFTKRTSMVVSYDFQWVDFDRNRTRGPRA